MKLNRFLYKRFYFFFGFGDGNTSWKIGNIGSPVLSPFSITIMYRTQVTPSAALVRPISKYCSKFLSEHLYFLFLKQ